MYIEDNPLFWKILKEDYKEYLQELLMIQYTKDKLKMDKELPKELFYTNKQKAQNEYLKRSH